MSMYKDIDIVVHDLMVEEDFITDPDKSRDAIRFLSEEIGRRFPSISIIFLAYPEAREGDDVHYALKIPEIGMIINPVPRPSIPQYIGLADKAHPIFGQMEITPVII